LLLPTKMRKINPPLLTHHLPVLEQPDPQAPYLPPHLLHPTGMVHLIKSSLPPDHHVRLLTQVYPRDQDSKPKVWVHQKP
jgi:hypothetical protein